MTRVRSAQATALARDDEPPQAQWAVRIEDRDTPANSSLEYLDHPGRGRGDSGARGAVSVQHEVDDIAALIEAVGGRASLWGSSSGGAVALRSAAADVGVEKLAVYETPFKTDPDAKYAADDYGARLEQIVAEGIPMPAAKHFMRKGIGYPLRSWP